MPWLHGAWPGRGAGKERGPALGPVVLIRPKGACWHPLCACSQRISSGGGGGLGQGPQGSLPRPLPCIGLPELD